MPNVMMWDDQARKLLAKKGAAPNIFAPTPNPTINPPAGSSSATSTTSLLSQASQAQESIAKSFYADLNKVLPTWQNDVLGTSKEALAKTADMASQLMSGELPDDVKRSIMRTRAELGISRGVFGEAQQFATAADIGKTSMDMMTAGAKLMGEVVSPLTERLLNNALKLMPGQVDPNQAFQTITSAQSAAAEREFSYTQLSINANQANAQLNWDKALSQFTAEREDRYTAEAQRVAQEQFDRLNPKPMERTKENRALWDKRVYPVANVGQSQFRW